MNRVILILCGLSCLSTTAALAAEAAPGGKAAPTSRTSRAAKPALAPKAAAPVRLAPPPALPVAQIVAKNVAARGGLSAWRAVTSLTMAGLMDAGGKQDTRLPFVLSLKRGHRSRLEIKFQDQTALQVWDGAQGWKVRPYLDRNEVEAYTPAEARSAAAAAELDGPLVDHERKGTRVELAGTEVVEGRYTYRLRLTPKGGEPVQLWVDAATFLEAKIEGEPRRIDGRLRKVAIYSRDFRAVGGLQFPHTLETVVETVKGAHKVTIQGIQVNPPLDDALFARPQVRPARLSAR